MSLISEHDIFKKTGGVFELPKRLMRISGPDAADFLHRLTTQDVKNLRPGFGFPAALLQPDAKIVSYFDLYHCGNFFTIIADVNLFQATFDYLERLHFAEDLKIEEDKDSLKFLSVQGRAAEGALLKILGRVPQDSSEVIGTENCFIARHNEFNVELNAALGAGNGYHLLVKTSQVQNIKEQLLTMGLPVLSLDLWNLLRSETGHFRFGVDVSEKNLILETALAGHVSRNKGCYPGQEVVERVFTYGNVSKKLVGLEWVSGDLPQNKPLPFKLFANGEEVGKVTSLVSFPWSQKKIGFAVVRRPFYEEGKTLDCFEAGSDQHVKIIHLPDAFEIKRELT